MANPRPYFEFKMARLWREAGAKGEGGRANGGAKRLSWLLAALLVLLSRQNTEAGIHGLGPLLLKEAPQSASERTLQDFQGKKLAIDASMAMYQFLIAVRVAGRDGVAHTLTTESGEDTSHLQGFFWRTIAMLRVGIKPLYVFDGKPPELKSGELAKRNMRREEGATKLKEAEEMGDVEEMNKFSKRTLRVTRQHAQDCKRLLALMGVPTLDAPCEAEAQCAALCKAGGDPLRLNVLRTLSNDSFGVLELAQIFAIGQSGMSHHLKVLAQAGLVATRREGNAIFYRRALPGGRLHAALLEEIDALPLAGEVQARIAAVHQQRATISRDFFARMAAMRGLARSGFEAADGLM
jgi:DNA-binding transcriptional ArsR family regulator